MSTLTTDMSSLTTDMSTLTTDMSTLTTDMSTLTTDMSTQTTDSTTLTSYISTIKTHSDSNSHLPINVNFEDNHHFRRRSLLSIEDNPKIKPFKLNPRSNGPALKELIFENNPDSSITDFSDFSDLVNLEKVVMKNIGFWGDFEADLKVFSRLKTIDLSNNQISSFNPKGIPNSLLTIDLSNNLIIKFDKTFLTTLTQPQHKSLHFNIKCKILYNERANFF